MKTTKLKQLSLISNRRNKKYDKISKVIWKITTITVYNNLIQYEEWQQVAQNKEINSESKFEEE